MGKKAAAAPDPAPVEEEKPPEPEPEILQGEFVFQDGSTYSGQFMKKGEAVCLHGQGMLVTGPESYEGTFADGMYKMGKFTSCSGAVYSGSFKGNKFHGVGHYRWPDGREYRGTWKNGSMHGRGEYLNFSVGADKKFDGFSLGGEFSSSEQEQDEAKKAFLAEYSSQFEQSATAALRDLAERATADGAPADYLVPQDEDSAKSIAEFVAGPFPEPGETAQALMQPFVARLAEGAEQPLEVTVYTGLGEPPRLDPQRLKKPQLQMAGQAVEFFAANAEAGTLQMVVLVNLSPEYDVEQAKWKLLQCQVVPAVS